MTNLREDEQFVIEALCETYGGEWRSGEDPPDAYISLNQNEIAVEISRNRTRGRTKPTSCYDKQKHRKTAIFCP